ncbi:mitochondrial import inner membrane translocase subunit Tim8 [Toxorhynchites rutilus septentrionalis]|uniref:mitochondrial import inner membrane translocase subunit Tim8 n=1 Tax=Toxorhynchites rutilus septentrionalis TaxID=329112 RepID=UPI0024790406|nr:mitochondrial import inner membrane translocase subunit Tim8 [Toxorhynchites rutilus septentrionalis]
MADFDAGKSSVDPELQDFLMAEKQKAQLSAQIHEFNDICWDKCVDKPGSKLDSRTETCLNNCVDRFIDTSLFIANRFAQTLQKGQPGM